MPSFSIQHVTVLLLAGLTAACGSSDTPSTGSPSGSSSGGLAEPQGGTPSVAAGGGVTCGNSGFVGGIRVFPHFFNGISLNMVIVLFEK